MHHSDCIDKTGGMYLPIESDHSGRLADSTGEQNGTAVGVGCVRVDDANGQYIRSAQAYFNNSQF
jgi:hypothetical protein